MALVNITEAARLTTMSEKTIRRKIGAGELSAQVQGQGGQARKMVDTSELLRVFGSLPGQPTPRVHPESPATPAHAPAVSSVPGISLEPFKQVIDTQKTLIAVLQSQLDARTQETRELRAQVAGLLEWRRPDPAPAPAQVQPSTSALVTPEVPPAVPASPDRLAKVNLILLLLIVATSVFVWTWTLGYRPWFMVH
jgi:hypothetical protein